MTKQTLACAVCGEECRTTFYYAVVKLVRPMQPTMERRVRLCPGCGEDAWFVTQAPQSGEYDKSQVYRAWDVI